MDKIMLSWVLKDDYTSADRIMSIKRKRFDKKQRRVKYIPNPGDGDQLNIIEAKGVKVCGEIKKR